MIAQTTHFGEILKIFLSRETAKNLPIMDPTDADSLLEALNHRFEPNVILQSSHDQNSPGPNKSG